MRTRVLFYIFGMTLFASPTLAETFDLKVSDFQGMFNSQSKKDDGELLKFCAAKPVSGIIPCALADVNFKKSLEGLKKLNLINGNFSFKEAIALLSEGGKVSAIMVIGDRSDPANLFHFIGDVDEVELLLDPSMSSDDITKDSKELGLMSGDSDEQIDAPKTAIHDKFAVTCVRKNSQISTGVGCRFEPRY